MPRTQLNLSALNQDQLEQFIREIVREEQQPHGGDDLKASIDKLRAALKTFEEAPSKDLGPSAVPQRELLIALSNAVIALGNRDNA